MERMRVRMPVTSSSQSGVELFVVEDFVDDSGAVRGRVGVFGADDGLDDGGDHCGFVCVGVTTCRPPARSP